MKLEKGKGLRKLPSCQKLKMKSASFVKGWYVVKNRRTDYSSFLNEGIANGKVVPSGGASVNYNFNHHRIPAAQTSSALASMDKNDLPEIRFQEHD